MEHKEMEKVLVGVMTGAVDPRVLTVVKSLVDFIYYAQLQSHTKRTLDALQTALDTFHSHKDVLVDLDIRKHFNIPKIHAMQHYVDGIRRLGSCDGFNTEHSERLHIDFAKNAYAATNGKDYTEQMTIWLQRREAIGLRTRFIAWYDVEEGLVDPAPAPDEEDEPGPQLVGQLVSAQRRTTYTIAKHPPAPHRSVAQIHDNYFAKDLIPALTTFMRQHFLRVPLPPSNFDFYDVFHQIKLALPSNRYISPKQRSIRIRAMPAVAPKDRKPGTDAIFDTALVITDPDEYRYSSGLRGLQPARIRLLFRLPSHLGTHRHPLAYIEWFTPLAGPDPTSGLYTTQRSTRNHLPNTAVISVDRIARSCHLMGQMRRVRDTKWTAFNVLDLATTFYFNPYIHIDTFTRQNLVL
ncbi:hypothetical protein HMN09_00845000 [Mycena chlorophos]|uniref:Uncharacterized protein n=1 Tax=Mycena chlorophos TaxID=658473 RepID=A0A8H6W7E4_MYCCL|nr:hypothetical protein HMN09_00845000 [Mycena chlorophos]